MHLVVVHLVVVRLLVVRLVIVRLLVVRLVVVQLVVAATPLLAAPPLPASNPSVVRFRKTHAGCHRLCGTWCTHKLQGATHRMARRWRAVVQQRRRGVPGVQGGGIGMHVARTAVWSVSFEWQVARWGAAEARAAPHCSDQPD